MSDETRDAEVERTSTADESAVEPVPPTVRPKWLRRLSMRLTMRDRLRLPRSFKIRWPRLIFAAAVLSIAALGVMLALLNSPLLEVKAVSVEGANVVSAASVRQLAGLKGEHVILADLEAAAQRIAAMPMVKEVTISRDWPDGVKVVIVERTPWGRWRANNTVWAIDSEGVILEGAAPPWHGPILTQVSALPAITAGARVDVSVVKVVSELHARGAPLPLPSVLAYEWSLTDGLVIVTEHGRIVFGDADGIDYKYAVWDQLEREAHRRGEPLLFADLRFGLRPRVEIGLNVGRDIRVHDHATADLGEQ